MTRSVQRIICPRLTQNCYLHCCFGHSTDAMNCHDWAIGDTVDILGLQMRIMAALVRARQFQTLISNTGCIIHPIPLLGFISHYLLRE
ncbi:hypothetical protein ABKN59_001572 [Abortiporus biennis]